MGGTLPEWTFQVRTQVRMTCIVKEAGAKANCVGCFVCMNTSTSHHKAHHYSHFTHEEQRLCEVMRFAPSRESKIWQR